MKNEYCSSLFSPVVEDPGKSWTSRPPPGRECGTERIVRPLPLVVIKLMACKLCSQKKVQTLHLWSDYTSREEGRDKFQSWMKDPYWCLYSENLSGVIVSKAPFKEPLADGHKVALHWLCVLFLRGQFFESRRHHLREPPWVPGPQLVGVLAHKLTLLRTEKCTPQMEKRMEICVLKSLPLKEFDSGSEKKWVFSRKR